MPRFRAAGAAAASLAALTFTMGSIVGTPVHAADTHLSCGTTITTDTVLKNDLRDCPSNGIVIGRDGITLDLDGHRIDGDGTEFADCPRRQLCDVGVANDGHDRITVKDGSVREFAVGALAFGARRAKIVRVSSTRNDFFGAVLGDSARSEVRDGSFSHNVAPDGDGIGLFGSDHVVIAGNSIRDNAGPGIHIDASASLIERNRLARNGPSMLIDGDGNEVRRNRVVRGAGIMVGPGDRNVIVANRIVHAGDALAVEDGSGNRLARNVVIDARGFGVRLGIGNPSLGGGHNLVRRNFVKGSANDGYRVFQKDGHSLLTQNVAVHSGGDGFAIRSRSIRLAGNRAKRNGALGIKAVRGVIDEGGNQAGGNGDARQCVHVSCR